MRHTIYFRTILALLTYSLLSTSCKKAETPLEISVAETSWMDTLSIPYMMQKSFSGGNLKKGKILARDPEYTRYYITYRSGPLTISGIMNVPKGKGPFPVLILNHGYINPKIYTNGRGLKREQDYLAKRGYVVIHPDYRNHADSDKDTVNNMRFRLGYVEDVINCVEAVKKSDYPFLDKERIGMLGHSMGGGICLNVMVMRPKLVKAFVLFGSVSSDLRNNFYRWTIRSPEGDSVLRRIGSPAQNPKFWDRISPISYLQNVESPVLIQHGAADESCPVAWARTLNDTLAALKKNVTYYEYPAGKHEFINEWPLVMKRTAEFFDRYLKN